MVPQELGIWRGSCRAEKLCFFYLSAFVLPERHARDSQLLKVFFVLDFFT